MVFFGLNLHARTRCETDESAAQKQVSKLPAGEPEGQIRTPVERRNAFPGQRVGHQPIGMHARTPVFCAGRRVGDGSAARGISCPTSGGGKRETSRRIRWPDMPP